MLILHIFTNIYKIIYQWLAKNWESIRKKAILEQLDKEIDSEDSDAVNKKRTSNLTVLTMANYGLLYIAQKLHKNMSKNTLDLYFMYIIMKTVVVTIIIFAAEYYALNRLDPTSFIGPEHSKSFFFYLYYSLTFLFTMDIVELFPISALAKIFTSMELICGAFIFVFLFFLMTTVIRQNYRDDIEILIDKLKMSSNDMERLLHERFEMSPMQAVHEVDSEEKSIAKLAKKLLAEEF